MLALLILIAIAEQRRSEHPDPEAFERRPASELAHLLAQDLRLFPRESATAVLTRPFGHRPAPCGHSLEPQTLRIGSKFPFASAPANILFALRRSAHFRR